MSISRAEAENLLRIHGTVKAAARASGIPYTTLQGRLNGAKDRKAQTAETYLKTKEASDLIFPDLPSSELPAEQLIEQACKRFEGHQEARDARRWMEIKVKSNKPIGVAFVGDPHIDNNGCNWPLLRRDIKILEDTEGLYAVNVGDLVDNWGVVSSGFMPIRRCQKSRRGSLQNTS